MSLYNFTVLAKWKAVISLSHALSRIHKHPKAISAVSHPHLTHELDVASGQRLVYEPFVDAAVLKAWEEYERAAALWRHLDAKRRKVRRAAAIDAIQVDEDRREPRAAARQKLLSRWFRVVRPVKVSLVKFTRIVPRTLRVLAVGVRLAEQSRNVGEQLLDLWSTAL